MIISNYNELRMSSLFKSYFFVQVLDDFFQNLREMKFVIVNYKVKLKE